MRHFRPSELSTYLEQHQPMLLDVREPWEYQICHLDGSHLIPMGQIPQQLDELPRDQAIVVICHHGIRSRQVGLYLQANGFEDVINLTGGVEAWAREVDQQMATY